MTFSDGNASVHAETGSEKPVGSRCGQGLFYSPVILFWLYLSNDGNIPIYINLESQNSYTDHSRMTISLRITCLMSNCQWISDSSMIPVATAASYGSSH